MKKTLAFLPGLLLLIGGLWLLQKKKVGPEK
jgi:hypothetical protein